MNKLDDITHTLIPTSKIISKRLLTGYFLKINKLKQNENIMNNAHHITQHYFKEIGNALTDNQDITNQINSLLESYIKLLKRTNLKDNNNQKLIFDQIIIFLNSLYRSYKRKKLFNTLSSNDLESFNKKTIGAQFNSINYGKPGGNNGCSCRHYTLLFKNFFDILKQNGLDISSYVIIERTLGLNHTCFILTFQGQNYLVDSIGFNNKLIQPVSDLGDADRFKIDNDVLNLNENLINYDNIPIELYINNPETYHKVALKDTSDLIRVLKVIPQELGSLSIGYKISIKRNLFDILLGNGLQIFNNGILVKGVLFYHFDHNFTEEELMNIDNNQLIEVLLQSITYKTNGKSSKPIGVFEYEQKYLSKNLLFFKDKIDYSVLRKILLNPENKY